MFPANVRAIGIPWYARETYGRVLKVMSDADNLPDTYDDWIQRAEQVERRLKAEGHIVVRAILDPDKFAAWCMIRGLNVDASGRELFANEAARDASRQTQ